MLGEAEGDVGFEMQVRVLAEEVWASSLGAPDIINDNSLTVKSVPK